jgi:NADPH:quinone reductase-like Zn-dependent oxidoreductase
VEVEGRELLEGEVCVKMLAAPINPSDINRIEGTYSQSFYSSLHSLKAYNLKCKTLQP